MSQESSDTDTKTDLSSMDASMNSMVSECYLASNESSRPGTPTKIQSEYEEEIEEMSSDHELYDDVIAECTIVPDFPAAKISSQVATPTVTPAEQDNTSSQHCPPQLNPTALMAALQHAATFQQAPNNNTATMLQSSRPQVTLGVNENLNNMLPSRSMKAPTILDNFNLDMCFVGENDLNMDELD